MVPQPPRESRGPRNTEDSPRGWPATRLLVSCTKNREKARRAEPRHSCEGPTFPQRQNKEKVLEGEQWEAVAGRPRWQGEARGTLSIKLRSDNNVG